MSEAASGAKAAPGSPPDPERGAVIADTFGLHVQQSPPLAWLAAFAALAALVVNQVLLPALNSAGKRAMLRDIERWGAFASNLTAISSLIAFGFGFTAFLRFTTVIPLRKRLLLAGSAGVFLVAVARAMLLERQATTAQTVLFALGAAHVLSSLVCGAAAGAAHSRYARVMAIAGSSLAIFALLGQLVQTAAQLGISLIVQLRAQEIVQALGEVCYLVLLIGMARWVLPAGLDTRSRVSRLVALFVLPIALGGMYLAERALQRDYALFLYHAQRVTLFIDTWPRLYAVPIALALASSIAAAIGNNPTRKQGAAGLLLLLGSGFAPHAPGRLLTSVLAMILIARSLIAQERR
jgi:hypothetical protein